MSTTTTALANAAPAAVDFSTYIGAFQDKLRRVFNVRGCADEASLRRGLPPFMMREVQSMTPLSVCIPEEYGGRGVRTEEYLSVLEAASYESLALSLTIGINGALFLQPVAKYGHEGVKADIFGRFMQDKNMGGLMITEPNHGTDALSMKTSFFEEDGQYRVRGTKHWGGLTGWADFWLIAAREQRNSGSLSRDIDFLIADQSQPGQEVSVDEVYENLGLYMIPYGRNTVDIAVPKTHRLEPESTGIKMMLDLLHRSRTQFPGMGMGYLRRLMDEALAHCRERHVGGKSLFNYDQVKKRLARLQAHFTTCSAMCAFASEKAGLENNLASETVSANAIKTVVTDLMQDAAQSLLQLTGADGYRLDHIAGRSLVDSRPFQIFEGSNDVLYSQISEAVLKQMRRLKETNLYDYLSSYDLTARAAERFEDTLDFEVDTNLPQRKLVELGRALGRIVSMEMTIELGDRGFRGDLVANCLHVLQEDVDALMCRYRSSRLASVVDDYVGENGWLDYVRPQHG